MLTQKHKVIRSGCAAKIEIHQHMSFPVQHSVLRPIMMPYDASFQEGSIHNEKEERTQWN